MPHMRTRVDHAYPMPALNRRIPVSLPSGVKTPAFQGILHLGIAISHPFLPRSERANYCFCNPRIRVIGKRRPSNFLFHLQLPARISRIFEISHSVHYRPLKHLTFRPHRIGTACDSGSKRKVARKMGFTNRVSSNRIGELSTSVGKDQVGLNRVCCIRSIVATT